MRGCLRAKELKPGGILRAWEERVTPYKEEQVDTPRWNMETRYNWIHWKDMPGQGPFEPKGEEPLERRWLCGTSERMVIQNLTPEAASACKHLTEDRPEPIRTLSPPDTVPCDEAMGMARHSIPVLSWKLISHGKPDCKYIITADWEPQ